MATRSTSKPKVLQRVGEIELVEYPAPERKQGKVIEARNWIPGERRERAK